MSISHPFTETKTPLIKYISSLSKMLSTSPDLPQKNTLQIKQDDKFFCSLLSKENSVANPSFRVYYGGVSGAIPFMWESQPGTPKFTFSDTTLPPLTPPPSYYSKSGSKPTKKHSRSGLMHALFPKFVSLKKTAMASSAFSSPSSSSSFSSSSSSSMFLATSAPEKYHRRSRFSSFDSRVDDDKVAAVGSPTSILCFGIGRVGKLRRRYGSRNAKPYPWDLAKTD